MYDYNLVYDFYDYYFLSSDFFTWMYMWTVYEEKNINS